MKPTARPGVDPLPPGCEPGAGAASSCRLTPAATPHRVRSACWYATGWRPFDRARTMGIVLWVLVAGIDFLHIRRIDFRIPCAARLRGGLIRWLESTLAN